MLTTTRESKRSSGARRSKRRAALDRPFDPKIWAQAERIGARYRLLLEPDEPSGFVARAMEMPTVFERGRTADASVEALRVALTVAIATMLEGGESPPPSSLSEVRRDQVNVRLSREEKLVLEAAARRGGYRGLSDFLRAVGLAHAQQPSQGPNPRLRVAEWENPGSVTRIPRPVR